MTLLGKLLTVLILVMSLVFMAFSIAVYSTHRNWNEEAQAKAVQVTDLRTKNDQLTTKIADIQQSIAHERASRASVVAALESHLSTVMADRETLEVDKREAEQLASKQLDALNTIQRNLGVTSGENQTLRSDIASAIEARDALFSSVVTLTDSLGQAEGTLESLKAYRSQLISQIGRFKLVLDRHGLDEDTQVFDIPPRLDGVVKFVNKGLIEVTIGFDEGLREGHTLEIYRGDTYLGRAIVRKAEPDKAVAEILKDYRKGSIQEGDKVATRTKIS